MSVMWHLDVDHETVGPALADMCTQYEGPVTIAQDLTTFTITRDCVVTRQAMIDPSAWPIRDRARTNERIAETVRDIDSEIFAAAEATLTELGRGPGQTRMLASLLVYAGIGYIHGHDGLPAISPDDVQRALAALLS